MASDNKASYARVGFTVAIGAAAIAATLVWFGRFRGKDSEFLVETYYDSPVSGLSVGSPVNFRGVKIGEVREIGFANVIYESEASSNDHQRIVITMALEKARLGCAQSTSREIDTICRRAIANGLRATVTSSGITGLSRIEIGIPENPPPPAKLSWRPRYILVPPAPSLLESFSVAATKMMNRLKTMDFGSVWSNVASAASSAAKFAQKADVVAASAIQISSNANAVVESQSAGVASIVQNVESAATSLRQLADALKDNPSLLLRPRDAEPLPETAR